MQNPVLELDLHGTDTAGRDDPFARLARARAAAGDHPDLRWLVDCAERWLADGLDALESGLPVPAMHRYFGIRSPRQAQLHLRDAALREAARHLDAAGRWTLALALEREWGRFVACPAWTCTLDRREPPPEFGKLRHNLWLATKFNNGRALRVRQIDEILGR